MDAFDADVLIYAAVPGHPLGRRVRALFPTLDGSDDGGDAPGSPGVGVGSLLLLPELLVEPTRNDLVAELDALRWLLRHLDLRPVDRQTATLAVALGATYGLRTVDATHLATAIAAAADRFITNNRSDFTPEIEEIVVTYPEDLPEPGPSAV